MRPLRPVRSLHRPHETYRGLKRSVKNIATSAEPTEQSPQSKVPVALSRLALFLYLEKRGGLLKCKLASFRIDALCAHSGEVPCMQRRRAEPLCIYAKAVFRQAPSSLIGVLPHHTQLFTQGYYF